MMKNTGTKFKMICQLKTTFVQWNSSITNINIRFVNYDTSCPIISRLSFNKERANEHPSSMRHTSQHLEPISMELKQDEWLYEISQHLCERFGISGPICRLNATLPYARTWGKTMPLLLAIPAYPNPRRSAIMNCIKSNLIWNCKLIV